MAVKIGSARIDENGKATGGKAGNQNGKELSSQNWYKHSKKWYLLRAKDPVFRALIAAGMNGAIANKHIGYDQNQRTTLLTKCKPLGYDPYGVTVDCECDCSSLVRVCILYGIHNMGWDVASHDPGNFRTTNQVKMIMATGLFDLYEDSAHCDKSDYLAVGDILVTRSQGHTVVVLSDGPKCDASKLVSGKLTVTGNSVYIRTAPSILTGKRVGVAHKGDVFQCLDHDPVSGWHMINYKGSNAWISNKYTKEG